MKPVKLAGTLTVGQGKSNELFHGTVNAYYGDRNKIDVLLSADGRHVFVQMDGDSARKLAETILAVVGPKPQPEVV